MTLINGFNPAAGNSFNLFDWASISGTFDAVNLPTLGGSLSWNTSQLYTTGALSVVTSSLLGDYNQNGFVDAADYTVWRDGLGTMYTAADYDQWKQNFGATADVGGTISENSAVPEPAALGLLVVGAIGLLLSREYRRY